MIWRGITEHSNLDEPASRALFINNNVVIPSEARNLKKIIENFKTLQTFYYFCVGFRCLMKAQ